MSNLHPEVDTTINIQTNPKTKLKVFLEVSPSTFPFSVMTLHVDEMELPWKAMSWRTKVALHLLSSIWPFSALIQLRFHKENF